MTTELNTTAIVKSNRGRKLAFANKFNVIDALTAIQTGSFKSRHLTMKLIDMGLVEAVTVKGEGRGRPRVVFQVTGKGRGRIALAKNWKR